MQYLQARSTPDIIYVVAHNIAKMLQRYLLRRIKNSFSSRHYASASYKGGHGYVTGNTVQHCIRELEQGFSQENMPETVCDIKFLIAKAIGLKTVSTNASPFRLQNYVSKINVSLELGTFKTKAVILLEARCIYLSGYFRLFAPNFWARDGDLIMPFAIL